MRFLYGVVTLLFTTSAFAQGEQRALPEIRFSLPLNLTQNVTKLTDSRISPDGYNGIGIRYEPQKTSGFVAKISAGNNAAPDLLNYDNYTGNPLSLNPSVYSVNAPDSYHPSRLVHVGYFFLRTLQTFSFDMLRK